MADVEKKYTQRDLVMAKRAAFADGYYASRPATAYDWCYGEAKRRYQLPKVTRPRVVRDKEWFRAEWKSDGCNIFWRLDRGAWSRYPESIDRALAWPDKARVAIWADLLANPTEEVEEDES